MFCRWLSHLAVPIYDGRSVKGAREFTFSDDAFSKLATWPLYKRGVHDLPFDAVVSVGYTLNTFGEGPRGGPNGLSTNLHFVILLALPDSDDVWGVYFVVWTMCCLKIYMCCFLLFWADKSELKIFILWKISCKQWASATHSEGVTKLEVFCMKTKKSVCKKKGSHHVRGSHVTNRVIMFVGNSSTTSPHSFYLENNDDMLFSFFVFVLLCFLNAAVGLFQFL